MAVDSVVMEVLHEYKEIGVNALAREVSSKLKRRVPVSTMQKWLLHNRHGIVKNPDTRKWYIAEPTVKNWPLDTANGETVPNDKVQSWISDPVAYLGDILKTIRDYKYIKDLASERIEYLQNLAEKAVRDARG